MNAARTAAIEAALAAPFAHFDPWLRRADNLLEKGKSPQIDDYADLLRPWFSHENIDELAADLSAKDVTALARHTS